ncbi:MAG: VOC family protein [Polyangiaceae bacterium]|nr:VOC family protein [Polyangiaceae bacterium]
MKHSADRRNVGQDRAVPILPVRNVRAAVAHYEKLGFQTSIHDPDAEEPTYGFAVRNGVEIHLTRHAHVNESEAGACYLHVDDAARIHATWKAAAVEGRITEIEDKPWGKREFAHVDPDGNLVRVGSDTHVPYSEDRLL